MDAKRGALVAAIMGSTVVAVDSTVVNVALPKIADELGGGLAGQQWVANSYLLTLSTLILVSGSLADIYGERRVFTLGVAGFGVASLLCALAPTVELLVVARALQGVAGALLTPASLAIIVAVFPESERGAAIGSWTAWGGIGYLAGPLIGGQIIDSVSWRWVFALNVPLVLITLLLASRYVPAGRDLGERAPAPGRDRRAAVRARPGRDLVRADRAAGARLVGPAGVDPAGRRRARVRRVHRVRAADARSRCCRSACSRGRNFTVANIETFADVRRHGGAGLLPRRCSCSRSPASARSRRARRGWRRRS